MSLASVANRTPARGMVIGSGGTCNDNSWGTIPLGCSAQTGGDWTAHYIMDGPNCNNGNYQLVCSAVRPTGTPTSKPTAKPTVIPTASPSKNAALVHKVRVQLEGTIFLHMREVQVYDMNGVNHALNKLATQSSTESGEEASKAVNGNLNDWSHTHYSTGNVP